MTSVTLDQCDNRQCSARILVTFGKENSNKKSESLFLGFCQHHGNHRYVELTRKGWDVIDDHRTYRVEDPRGTASKEKSKTTASPESGPGDDANTVHEDDGDNGIADLSGV